MREFIETFLCSYSRFKQESTVLLLWRWKNESTNSHHLRQIF